MKIPTEFLYRVLLNEALQVGLSVERDYSYICSRFEDEGVSFLTISLPSLDDALVQGLTQGHITPSLFLGFKPWKKGGKLPALFSGFFMRIFNLDGSLLERPCIASIRAIRQVTRLFKKVELPCSDDRVKAAFERYVSNDESIDSTPSYNDDFRVIASYLWSDLEVLSGELYCSPGVFGTGASAERASFNERHSIKHWPERCEPWFPISFHGSHREDDFETFNGIEFLSRSDELPVRVVQVPKTLKTPRIISVEPSYMMLMQQSIAKPLMSYLESEQFKFKSIRFTDQSVNRDLARVGSIDGNLATIDLKDASDLVSNNLVIETFQSAPTFLDLIQACRSYRAKMPDGSLVYLKKFASQGSALCFPIEAMVFFTIVLYSLVRQSGKRPSNKLLQDIAANVSVYGDDIIVPAETATGVMNDLELFGLKVNRDKSFTTGLFRESCGGDYYAGVDVTPTYVRRWDFSGNTRDPRVLESYVSLSNQFYLKGLWNASQYIRDHVRSVWRGRLSRSTAPIGVLTYASVLFNTGLCWDSARSCWRVKGPRLQVGRKSDPVRDIRAGMLVCFSPGELRERRERISLNPLPISGRREFEPIFKGGDKVPLPYYKLSQSLSCSEWELFYQFSKRKCDTLSVQTSHLGDDPGKARDLTTSVDSYTSKTKYRWALTKVSIPGYSYNKIK